MPERSKEKKPIEPADLFASRLAEWSNDNQKLVKAFRQDKQIQSMRDIAIRLDRSAFVEKVKAAEPEASDEERQALATGLRRKLFQLEPTALVVNLIKDPQVSLLNDAVGAQVAAVLERKPDFNIKTTSVYEVIGQEETWKDIPTDRREPVAARLKTLQRIAAITPDADAMPTLYNANLHSALQISAMPQTQFLAVMRESGLDESTARQIHDNAVQARVRNEQAIMALREARQGTGVAMIDRSMNSEASVRTGGAAEGDGTESLLSAEIKQGSTTEASVIEQELAKRHLSWDLLFGDADLCECGECTSVYSAAAYYVELLQYLRNNNLDPAPGGAVDIQPDPKMIDGTPLEKLFDRRPDLGCLELTCKNTNTVLPYVDLVNEVMENYVAFKRPKPFNVEDETSGELLAEPQHTEYQAYCILKNEVYPFNLPYHQPIDAERLYLQHLDTSRHEVMDTFRRRNADADADVVRLKDEAQERAVAAEFLGMTMEEYVIVTQECYESKELMDKLKNKAHTDEEYRQLIGVKPVCQYYGYDSEEAMLGDEGLTLIKDQLLRRTGIDYADLVALLQTGYVNPRLPRGKSRRIMESLHFSYRFLQNYAAAHGLDRMAEQLLKGERLAKLIPELKEKLAALTNKEELRCPPPDRREPEITERDIVHWVKCQFAKVGKMIVIESGRGCVDGEVVRDGKPVATIEDCKILLDYRERKLEIGQIDRANGKVTFRELPELQAPIDPGEWKELLFQGAKGERGLFLIVDKELHLIFLEQRDSCDLDAARLQHLDGTPLSAREYDRIHRFIRLWRKLGWTIEETDLAIAGLGRAAAGQAEAGPAPEAPEASVCEDCGDEACGDCDGCNDCDDCDDDAAAAARLADINPRLVHQLAAVKRLAERTGLELAQLLVFWGELQTAGDNSPYARLFLTHHVRGLDPVFEADDKGRYLTDENAKLADHLPAAMAALRMTAEDIRAVSEAAGLDGKLTLANLSALCRYRLAAQALGWKTAALVQVLPLFGDVFRDADATLVFFRQWDRIASAGFAPQQLNYLIRGQDEARKPLAPSRKDVLMLSKKLYDGLNEIDAAHPDAQAQPDIELVRAKASLLFDAESVETIVGLLEGSGRYTTNAPKHAAFVLPESLSLSRKLTYDEAKGTVQIKGILTEAEAADYRALVAGAAWASALARIEKQQEKPFKALLSGVFAQESTKSAAEKAAWEAEIRAGDVAVPVDQIPEGEEDPNTAPRKRAAFLGIFLPYLRQQLSRRFVIDTLAAHVGLDAKTAAVLVEEALLSGAPAAPIYGVFAAIKDSAKPDEAGASGMLLPPADADYTLIVRDSDAQPAIRLDGKPIAMTAQEDPTNEWWSEPIPLQAGRPYKLEAAGVSRSTLHWKKPASAITAIPSSVWIPDFASAACEPALLALHKAALLVAGFGLSADEIRYLHRHKADFGGLDWQALTLAHWLRLEAYVRLRDSLPQTELGLLEFWQWTGGEASDEAQLAEKIAGLTAWDARRIGQLIAANHFRLGQLSDYRNEIHLLKLQQAMSVADKIGADIDSLFEWAAPGTKFHVRRRIADSIKQTVRARYSQAEWEQAAKPLHDRLRNRQKEALIGYLLQRQELIDWGVRDADGLFEYFLIDVQMEPCMETSRIKQAINAVQLFVQRCFLGLEEEHGGIRPDMLDRPRWDWMQRYRVWEANRKVFLYPENWIESSLRDDKSPFFKELEGELLQKDVNKQNVLDALKSYLYKVDEVANMEVVGLYIDGTRADGRRWSPEARLHVFARTRNAPYLFYYRYLALDEMNWYPWEKMQLDIPSYDVEAHGTRKVIDNGCYLTPVVWNGRLLVFFPQIAKKTKPAVQSGSFSGYGNDSNGIGKTTPVEFFEIRMAWSEYRNGKWTQKQVSKDSLFTDPLDEKHDMPYFKFVPIVDASRVLIDVDDKLDEDGSYLGAFAFNGTAVKTGSSVATKPMPIDYFNQDKESAYPNRLRMYSWQVDAASKERMHPDVYFYDDGFREYLMSDAVQEAFHHPDTQHLLGEANRGRLERFFERNLSMTADSFGSYDHDDDYATPDVFHELKRPYSLYNWELFFHTPLLLADALSKAGQYEEAAKWFHYVFNPIADGSDDRRFWQFRPFRSMDSRQVLDGIFLQLEPNKADEAINEWRGKPFMPHVVARSRPVAYMKWVVMKYLDNLLAWGDDLFRQDTIESINQATQLYVLAGHILGPRPMTIPKRGKVQPQTYLSLLDKWDAFGNAMVELELSAPFSNQTALPAGTVNGELAFPNIYGLASSLYFCIPNNPKLIGYWDTIADRLYKIRHCLNIEGVFRKLPLFEPPIDPALLVKAAAQGLSIASVLSDLNAPMPNYRFYYTLQKALELCAELKSMGGAMLTVIEKQEGETIALLRAKHESVMQSLLMEIKKQQLEEAQRNLDTLAQVRKTLEARMKYQLKLIGAEDSLVPAADADFTEMPNEIATVDGGSGLKLIPFEKEDLDKASEAADWQIGIGVVETLASVFHALPTMTVDGKPLGVGVGAMWGFPNLANATAAVARGLRIHADHLGYQSASAGKKAGLTRALQDRIFQANAAGYELKQIDKQMTAQQIRVALANLEIANQQQAIDHASEIEDFIRSKYTNEELYAWMRGSLKTLYRQVYNLAYDLAKKAERTYGFERGLSSANYIQPGYFDAGREGLLAGEQLYAGLKQLEAAYQHERGHDYEITRHISLYQLHPLAVIQLRETGACEFALPEVLFDLDYPGHYKRRIKSVSLSIPCVAGPYTGVNATLRLLANKFRNTAAGGKAYEESAEETDDRFSAYAIPVQAIAASTAQNDSGVFELNFNDERYLPFEGAGAISKWRLELPSFRQFDYQTIADVVLHLKYTSCEGGERLKAAAEKSAAKRLADMEQALGETGMLIALNMKHELPGEWHLLKTGGSANVQLGRHRLPYLAQMLKAEIEQVTFVAKVAGNPAGYAIGIDGNAVALNRVDAWGLCKGSSPDIQLGTDFALTVDAADLPELEELMLVVKVRFPV